MKKPNSIIRTVMIALPIVMVCLLMFAEKRIIFKSDDGQWTSFAADSITFSRTDANGTIHDGFVMQNLYKDGEMVTSQSMDQETLINIQEPYIIVSRDTFYCPAYYCYIDIEIISNIACSQYFQNEEDWIGENSGYGIDGGGVTTLCAYENSTEKERTVNYIIENTEHGISKAITIVQSPFYNFSNYEEYPSYLRIERSQGHTISWEGDQCVGDWMEYDFPFDYDNEISILGVELDPEQWVGTEENLFGIEIKRGTDGKYILSFPENPYDDFRTVTIKIQNGVETFQFGATQVPNTYPTYDELKAGWMAFFNCLDENSQNCLNWDSESDITNWNNFADLSKPYPKGFNIGCGLVGTLPKELAPLLSCEDLSLGGNYLHGTIPDEFLEHPNWNKFGWNIIVQGAWWFYCNGYVKPGFDNKDFNLTLPQDGEVETIDGEKSTLFAELAKNEVTLVCSQNSDWGDYYILSDARINQWLSYKDKGYGIILNYETDKENSLKESQDYPEDITFLWQMSDDLKSPMGFGIIGTVSLYDREGRLIDILPRDWDIPEEWYNDYIETVLQERLGDPIEHDTWSRETYTSSDYSRDGEVIVVQEATIGKGIDLVFMGDAFDDRDMEDGGTYETKMREGIEYFFADSWVSSFRDRFNVYIVKVVSPNNSHVENGEHRINYDDSICLEYASNIPNINLDNVTIVNIFNDNDGFWFSAYTNMYESGASVAHITKGGAWEVIIHEAVGHGMAKLADEYVFPEGIGQTSPEENKEVMEYYKAIGWHANLDFTDDPEEVQWSHFLTDSRYADEVGIYEGAWWWEFGAYRPSEQSTMNNGVGYVNQWNAPSREAIYKTIMQWSEGEDWTYDFEDFVAWDQEIKAAVNPWSAPAKNVKVPKQMRGGSSATPEVKHLPGKIIKTSPTDILRGAPVEVIPSPF
ncbi:MAG: M64 family metallopeptidase [Bacteroidales bacterium]|nr:M64 family metallopeptidase [Bacteroidales bacterium]